MPASGVPAVVFRGLQAAAGALVLTRLARGRTRRPPLAAPAIGAAVDLLVVVPARDEAARVGPCLEVLVADPGYCEVIVVDDGSTDETAEVARRLGARVITAGEPPPGWTGKPWALQRGLEAVAWTPIPGPGRASAGPLRRRLRTPTW